MKTTLTSLPRNLPPKVAAATLAATLRGARQRRVRRRSQRAAAAVLVLLAASALWPRRQTGLNLELAGNPTSALETPAHSVVPELTLPEHFLASNPEEPIAAAAPAIEVPPPGQRENSFVLIRSRPLPVAPPVSRETRDLPVPSCTVVRTASVPSPLIVTTARAAAALTVATGDQPEAPVSASDDDLFLLADGRPAALCRFPSGDTRWIWLTSGGNAEP